MHTDLLHDAAGHTPSYRDHQHERQWHQHFRHLDDNNFADIGRHFANRYLKFHLTDGAHHS